MRHRREATDVAFAENLKRTRREKGISQEQLAELLDVSRQAVSKWEQGIGYPEVEKLLTLSKKLNVSLDALMADSGAEWSVETPTLSAAEDRGVETKKKTRVASFACAALLGLLLAACAAFLRPEQSEPADTGSGTRLETGEVVARCADSLVIEADGVIIQGLGKNPPDAQIYYAFYVDEDTQIQGADGAELKSLWTIEPGMSVEVSFKEDESPKAPEQTDSEWTPTRTDIPALSVKIKDEN